MIPLLSALSSAVLILCMFILHQVRTNYRQMREVDLQMLDAADTFSRALELVDKVLVSTLDQIDQGHLCANFSPVVTKISTNGHGPHSQVPISLGMP